MFIRHRQDLAFERRDWVGWCRRKSPLLAKNARNGAPGDLRRCVEKRHASESEQLDGEEAKERVTPYGLA
jgi:hypothetical protein